MIRSRHPLRASFDAVLFDLDGTLLDRDERITARTYRAVRRLVDGGFEVLLATGRSVAGSLSVYRGLGLSTPLCCYNGSWIGTPGRRPWRLLPIPDDLLPEVEQSERRSRFFFRHEGHRKHTVAEPHPHFERIATWYENVVRVAGRTRLPRKRLMRVSCYFDSARETEAAWAALSDDARSALTLQHYPMHVFPAFESLDLYLGEIQPRTRGKAEVFDWLERERGIPASRVIAVGDQRNDLSMLRAAGRGVAVGNAVPEAKAAADQVIGRHDEEGIARWIEAGMPGAEATA